MLQFDTKTSFRPFSQILTVLCDAVRERFCCDAIFLVVGYAGAYREGECCYPQPISQEVGQGNCYCIPKSTDGAKCPLPLLFDAKRWHYDQVCVPCLWATISITSCMLFQCRRGNAGSCADLFVRSDQQHERRCLSVGNSECHRGGHWRYYH